MAKYICECLDGARKCTHETTGFSCPTLCCVRVGSKANWHKVEEQKRDSSAPKMPEWCKVGAWVWFRGDKFFGYDPEYLKITAIGYNGKENVIDCGKKINFPLSVVKQARLRPWTYKEAPETLKVISKCEPEQMICLFLASRNKHSVQYTTLPAWYIDVKILMDKYLQLDGSPCGVLEHYENGEWVE